ncbi:hypothetical protein BJF78_17555 [Pseudonocardia sp. CNS-139]|nr:hypothetical protein BJF78_17555 [Pseudonocardia sp. CNS-139]
MTSMSPPVTSRRYATRLCRVPRRRCSRAALATSARVRCSGHVSSICTPSHDASHGRKSRGVSHGSRYASRQSIVRKTGASTSSSPATNRCAKRSSA